MLAFMLWTNLLISICALAVSVVAIVRMRVYGEKLNDVQQAVVSSVMEEGAVSQSDAVMKTYERLVPNMVGSAALKEARRLHGLSP